MTWKDFKDLINKQYFKDDDLMDYISVDCYGVVFFDEAEITIYKDEECGIRIEIE